MKKGILVYDKKDAQHNKWFIDHIIEVSKEYKLEVKLILTEDILGCDPSEEASAVLNRLVLTAKDTDFAIMRNRNVKMSLFFEENGIRCFNSSYVCRIGNDKWEMYKDFCKTGIPVMYTQESRLPFPFVMKPRNGHGGQNVFFINNREEYEATVECINASYESHSSQYSLYDYIYQMPCTEKGRDIRVYVVGDTILTSMERKSLSETEFRANFSLGGTAAEHSLTEEELKLAAKVADLIKPDFAGIDIIYNNGKPVVNEIEDAVGTRMLYSHTDIDAVREYVSWISKVI